MGDVLVATCNGVRFYRTDYGAYVAADGEGWIPGSWLTLHAALNWFWQL